MLVENSRSSVRLTVLTRPWSKLEVHSRSFLMSPVVVEASDLRHRYCVWRLIARPAGVYLVTPTTALTRCQPNTTITTHHNNFLTKANILLAAPEMSHCLFKDTGKCSTETMWDYEVNNSSVWNKLTTAECYRAYRNFINNKLYRLLYTLSYRGIQLYVALSKCEASMTYNWYSTQEIPVYN